MEEPVEQDTDIRKALEENNLEAVKKLLPLNKQQDSLLFLASKHGHVDIFIYLYCNIENSSSAIDNEGCTPLHYASQNGHLDMVKVLIVDYKYDPSALNHKGETPYHLACGHLEVLKYFIECVKIDVQQRNDDNMTLLHIACKEGNMDVIRYLIVEAQIDPNSPAGPTKEKQVTGLLPHHIASMHGRFEVFKYLIETHNCDPNAVDSMNRNAVYLSGDSGNLDLLKYLVEDKGCDANHRSGASGKVAAGRVALHGACFQGHLDFITYLVEKCHCDPSTADEAGVTPLACAAQEGKPDTVRYLCINCKCAPNVQDNTGKTPLHYACMKGHVDVVRALAEVEANVDILDNNGEPPVIYAARNQHKEVVEYLVTEKDCNVKNDASQSGKSVLHFAANYDWIDIVNVLVTTKGLSPEAMDNAGLSAVHYSVDGGAMSVLRYLLEERKCNSEQMSDEGDSGTTPLLRACSRGKLDIVQYLVRERKCGMTPSKNKRMSPLHFGCSGGHLEVCKFLIEEGVQLLEIADSQGALPIHLCILNGHIELTKYLIQECHVDPMKKTKNDATGIHAACQGGHLELLKFLLYDCHLEANWLLESTGTPLDRAVEHGYLDIVKYLVLNDICNPHQRSSNGCVPLHWAALKGQLEVTQFLTDEVSCDVMIQDSAGHIPLHLACDKGHEKVIMHLLRKDKSQIACQNFKGQTPLQCAKTSGKLSNDVLLEFLKHGAEPAALMEVAPASFNFLKSYQPLYSYLKIFLLGEHSKLVHSEEAGSLLQFPSNLNLSYKSSGMFGDAIFYEIPHYQLGFEGFLSDAIVLCEHPVFVIGINGKKPMEDIQQQAHYWLWFITLLLRYVNSDSYKPLIVFAMANLGDMDWKVAELYHTYLISLSLPEHSQLLSTECINSSDVLPAFAKFVKLLAHRCNLLQQSQPVDALSSALKAFIKNHLETGQLFCNFQELLDRIAAAEAPLPMETTELSNILSTLSKNGYILYLKNSTNITSSWIILDVELSLTLIRNAISDLKTSNSLGLLTFQEVVEKAAGIDPSLFIELIIYFGLCVDVKRNKPFSEIFTLAKEEPLYFFPHLLPSSAPTGLCISTRKDQIALGWLIQCKPPGFFPPDFSSRLPAISLMATKDPHLTKMNGTFAAWNSGVHWSRDGIKVAILNLRSEAVLVIAKSKRENYLPLCMKRSEIVQSIIALKEELTKGMATLEYLLHPRSLKEVRLDKDPSLDVIPVTDVIKFFGRTKEMYGCSCEELVGFEPFFVIEGLKNQFFDSTKRDSLISSHDLEYLVHEFAPYWRELQIVLQVTDARVDDTNASYAEKARTIFEVWIDGNGTNATYKLLWTYLEKYSLFQKRDINFE